MRPGEEAYHFPPEMLLIAVYLVHVCVYLYLSMLT